MTTARVKAVTVVGAIIAVLLLMGATVVGSYAFTIHRVDQISYDQDVHRCQNVELIYHNTFPSSKLHRAYGKVAKRDGCHV